MKIAAFNGFLFHDEMFGYIIHFCKHHKHELTLFCHTEYYNHYIEFYKKHFHGYYFNVVDMRLFDQLKYGFERIFLMTDIDQNFKDNDPYINSITIRIDHYGEIRRENINNFIATRPFKNNYRKWALPCYPIYYSVEKYDALKQNNTINIMILGNCRERYDEKIINRLQCESNKPIIINVVSRKIKRENFVGWKLKVDVCLYENITTNNLIDLLKNTNYLLTDAVNDPHYEENCMSGSVPIAFSTLTTLVISKQSNKYYNFKNVIEFDKDSQDIIYLKDVDLYQLEQERSQLISAFSPIVLDCFATM
uniref:Glycosyl transferase family 1 domain-containing protein n=1 Tax=viral metagenome TaxID=1070528 RepID=A0A6C0JG02_9ZZZZ